MIYLETINSVPLSSDEFSQDFESWLSSLVDTLNENIVTIEDSINGTARANHYTTAEITALAPTVPNGTFFYDTDTNQLKAKVNSVVVVIA